MKFNKGGTNQPTKNSVVVPSETSMSYSSRPYSKRNKDHWYEQEKVARGYHIHSCKTHVNYVSKILENSERIARALNGDL